MVSGCRSVLGFHDHNALNGHIGEDMKKHYIAMAGLNGCLPQTCCVHGSYKDAVNDMANLHDLNRTKKAKLRKYGYLELNPYEDGNGYIEITACTCNNPEQHNDK